MLQKLCSKYGTKSIISYCFIWLLSYIMVFFLKGVIARRISAWDEIKAIANIIIIIIIIIVSYETTSLRKLNLPFQLGLKFHFNSSDC